MLDGLLINFQTILLTSPNPFNYLRYNSPHAGDLGDGKILATAIDYSKDIYTLLIWIGFFGALISFLFYIVVRYMLMAGSLTPRIAYERKETVKQIFLWTIILFLVVALFGTIQKMAGYF